MRARESFVYNENTMKKSRLLSLLIPLVFSNLASCGSSSTPKQLTYGTMITQEVTALKELSNTELFDKGYNEEETFILAAYQGEYSKDCTCWDPFKNLITTYMNRYHECIYLFDAQAQDDDASGFKIRKLQSSTLYFYVFKGHKKLAEFANNNQKFEEMFNSVEELYKGIHKQVSAPNLYYVDDEYLKENLAKEEQSIVLFARRTCGDCKYVIPNVILPYINSHEIKKNIYLFDMQDAYDISRNETATDEEKAYYQGIKDYYGLSVSGNETYGYKTGVVPTMSYYEKGVVKDTTVFFNDAIDQRSDGTFYVSESYYSEERLPNLNYLKNKKASDSILVGKSIENQDINQTSGGAYYWSQSAAAKVHKPLLLAFLDYYLL